MLNDWNTRKQEVWGSEGKSGILVDSVVVASHANFLRYFGQRKRQAECACETECIEIQDPLPPRNSLKRARGREGCVRFLR